VRCTNVAGGTSWEPVPGFSRTVRVGAAHRAIRPACTMVAVAGLVSPAMVVEIEAEAILERRA